MPTERCLLPSGALKLAFRCGGTFILLHVRGESLPLVVVRYPTPAGSMKVYARGNSHDEVPSNSILSTKTRTTRIREWGESA